MKVEEIKESSSYFDQRKKELQYNLVKSRKTTLNGKTFQDILKEMMND